jgi:hypothetical protein
MLWLEKKTETKFQLIFHPLINNNGNETYYDYACWQELSVVYCWTGQLSLGVVKGPITWASCPA